MDGKAKGGSETPLAVSGEGMSGIRDFALASTPELHFGAGRLSVLPGKARTFGNRVLLVHGGRSFISSAYSEKLLHGFEEQAIKVRRVSIEHEPTPSAIDFAVQDSGDFSPDCVVAIGGGSVLDAGKAISAMLLLREPVREYLEGVGTKIHPGIKLPFIAVPTTSGTGSEATKNAVISEVGENGFKRSLRHNNFVPDLAIVDPLLTLSCPKATTAATGMDAFTQLLESYLSTSSNPITDALALEGLQRISRSLLHAWEVGEDEEARTDLALAAYLSGVTLANAGLGLVHGFASPLGALFNIPHGVVCSALMAPANKITVRKLRSSPEGNAALEKYARVGKIFAGNDNRSEEYYADFLVERIDQWTKQMEIPSLSECGVSAGDFNKIVATTDNKNNPVRLNAEEMWEVLEMAL